MPFQKGNPGKPKGATNKAGRELKQYAQTYTKEAITALVALGRQAESEHTRVTAWREVLDRAVGKAPQAITDADGEALNIPAAIAFVFRQQAGAENRE